MNDLVGQLNTLWSQLLDLLSKIIVPDWGSVIGLLPLLLLVGVVGPLLSLVALVWFVYIVRAPRPKITFEEGPRPAPLDAEGRPVFPPGEPYCTRDGLVYPPGTTRCGACRDDLGVRCPMCGIARSASLTTCGNCGLVLKVEPRARALRPAGPPPGGAAIA